MDNNQFTKQGIPATENSSLCLSSPSIYTHLLSSLTTNHPACLSHHSALLSSQLRANKIWIKCRFAQDTGSSQNFSGIFIPLIASKVARHHYSSACVFRHFLQNSS